MNFSFKDDYHSRFYDPWTEEHVEGFLLVGGNGTDRARGISVGVVAFLMNRSSACSHRRWHKILLGIMFVTIKRTVCFYLKSMIVVPDIFNAELRLFVPSL